MKKSMVIVIIQFVVVAAVLALTVVSYAWYTNHNVATTDNVTITAAETSEVHILPEPDDYVPYKGETGQGYNNPNDPNSILDTPYSAEKRFTAIFKPIENQGPYALTAYFDQINIAKTDGEVIDEELDPEIIDSFTFRLHIYNDDNERMATFAPQPNSNLVVLIEGSLVGIGEYMYFAEETMLKCGFEVIFLAENAYTHWLKGEYDLVQEFRYCDYDFMRAMFHVVFTTGMSVPQEGEL